MRTEANKTLVVAKDEAWLAEEASTHLSEPSQMVHLKLLKIFNEYSLNLCSGKSKEIPASSQ